MDIAFIQMEISKLTITKNTINNYLSLLKKYEINYEYINDSVKFELKNYNRILININNMYCPIYEKIQYLHTFIIIAKILKFKKSEIELKKQIVKFNKIHNKKYNKIIKEDKITYVELYTFYKKKLKKLNKLKLTGYNTISDSDYDLLQDTLLLSFYLSDIYTNPPRRIQDYVNMYFDRNSTKNYPIKYNNANVAILTKSCKEFVFKNFKTYSKYGLTVTKINDELYNILKLFIKYQKNVNIGWILQKKNDNQYYSIKIQKIFNSKFQNITLDYLRNIIFSYKLNNDISNKKNMDNMRLSGTTNNAMSILHTLNN